MRTLVRIAVIVVVAGAGMALSLVALAPQVRALFTAGATTGPHGLDLAPLSERSVVYARDGSVLELLHAEEDRAPVPLARVPPQVVNAVLDTEDARFFQHGAIDARSMLRALFANVQAGGVREGGSTITQQLVKNALLTPRQDLHRKLKEAVLAVRLGDQMTKREILERYLNTVYFGNGAYGVQAAAERYFGTDVTQLKPEQAALMAGLIRNPVGYDPFRFPQVARDRRNVVLDRMVSTGHLSPGDSIRLKETPLPGVVPQTEIQRDDYFTEEVKERLLCETGTIGCVPGYQALGDTAQDRYQALFRGGLRIHTTLDPHDQGAAQDKVRTIVPDTQGRFEAALVSVDPGSGAVRALVGGPGFDRFKFDLATHPPGRQAGSAFKPFTLMAALEAGHSPNDTIDGTSPCTIPNPGGTPNPWQPSNVEGEQGGSISLVDATAHSINCAYARLVKIVGPEKVADTAIRMGIPASRVKPPIPVSITLGTREVTPLDMASAYATLAADGERHSPYFVDRVDDRTGHSILSATPKGERGVSAQLARSETQVLKQVVLRGTGRAAAVPGWEIAGKTGTTDDFGNAWFVGYSPTLATAVWMGAPGKVESMNDVGGIKVYGGTYPARIFGEYMAVALADTPKVGFKRPEGVNESSNFLHLAGDPGSPSQTTSTSSLPPTSVPPPSTLLPPPSTLFPRITTLPRFTTSFRFTIPRIPPPTFAPPTTRRRDRPIP